MNKKKIVASLAAVAVVATLFAGCGTTTTPTPTPSKTAAKSDLRVALSTDEGGLNDKSFNQAANEGATKASKEFGFSYKAIESKTKEDYEPNLNALIQDKSNLVFGVGFQMETALENVAKANPTVNFCLIDSGAYVDATAANPVQLSNVQSFVFKANESSFLMGVIAGKMTKTNKIGFIGGKDMDLISNFEAGFAAGVKSVNPAAAVGLTSPDGKAFGKTVKYADSFADTTIGYTLAKSLMADGCDVLYHAAGGVGEGMFQAIQEAKDAGQSVWGIGVDMDQAVTLPKYADIILSSCMKRVDTATYEASKELVDGTFQGGKITALGLKENGVDIAPSSSTNTPKDVLDLVAKYKAAIVAGTIVVPTNRAEVMTFTPAAIN
jgi:basic membrane protein A